LKIPTFLLLLDFDPVSEKQIRKILGLVHGHTVFAIWLGKDLSAIARLILGGKLIEYTEIMGQARAKAVNRMIAQAWELGADAVINMRYMPPSVVGKRGRIAGVRNCCKT